IELMKEAVKSSQGSLTALSNIPHPSPLPLRLGSGQASEGRGNSRSTGLDSVSMPQITFREPADRKREMAETVILALRLREGLDIAGFAARFEAGVAEVFPEAWAETQELGLTEVVDGRLRLRDEAVLVGDEAMWRFLPEDGTPSAP